MKKILIESLYPEFNNLYGDRGNLLYLQKKLSACNCTVELVETHLGDIPAFVRRDVDFLYIGPCTERQQELELEQLVPYGESFSRRMEGNAVTLATGNAFELFGQYIQKENGEQIPALGLFGYHAERFSRLRYNELCVGDYGDLQVTGFKNQLSHSYGAVEHPFLTMETGSGLNPETPFEGVRINHFFATYLLGPLLPLNPDFTNLLLKELLGEDFRPLLLPYEDIAYACRVSELLSPLTKKKTKK